MVTKIATATHDKLCIMIILVQPKSLHWGSCDRLRRGVRFEGASRELVDDHGRKISARHFLSVAPVHPKWHWIRGRQCHAARNAGFDA